MPGSTARAYRPDLAAIHDAGFGQLAQSAAEVLLGELRRRGLRRGLVVDLGCGSGALAERLTAAGYDALGIDISAAMVALARRRVPRAHFRVGSLLSADIPPCVAVTAVGECFNYLFDQATTKRRLLGLFRRVYDALDPSGLLLFDVAEAGRVPGTGPHRAFTAGEGWVVLLDAEEDRRRGLLTRHITTFRQVGRLYRRDDEVHRLRLLSRTELAAQLREIGFRVRYLYGYGSLAFGRGHAGLLARRP